MIYPRELASPYPDSPTGKPMWSPDTAWPDSWVLIGAMAAVTQRLRFSNAVYVAPARPLLEVVKQVATASVVSQGRVSLAVGVGWMREEFELMGQDFDTRGKRLNEMIPALRALWRGGWVSWSGEYYQVPELMIEPHPEAPVPILCGGESDAALRRAARLCDGWVGYAYAWDDAVGYVEKLSSPAPRVRARERAVRDHAGAARTTDTGSVQAGRGHRHHRGDVRPVGGPGSAAGRCRALPGTDRAVRRNHHREGAVRRISLASWLIRQTIRSGNWWSASTLRWTGRDWSTFDALVSPRVVVEVGSSAPVGLDEWRANLEEFYRGFPDGRHVIEELLVDGSHGVSRCRFVGTHTGEFQGRAPTGDKVSDSE